MRFSVHLRVLFLALVWLWNVGVELPRYNSFQIPSCAIEPHLLYPSLPVMRNIVCVLSLA